MQKALKAAKAALFATQNDTSHEASQTNTQIPEKSTPAFWGRRM